MMLAPMQGNPPVFAAVHSPSSDCQSSDLRPLSTPVSVPNYRVSAAPQMIPIAMVPPPFLVGPGRTNYTIVPTTRSNEGIFNSMQLPGRSMNAKSVPPTGYYDSPGQQSSPGSPNSDGGFVPLPTSGQAQSDSRAIEHTHAKLLNRSSPSDIEQSSFLSSSPAVVAGSSSVIDPLLDRGSSSSDPQLTEHHRHSHCEGGEVSSGHRRRRKKHSKRRRHHHHEKRHHPPATDEQESDDATESCPPKRRNVKNEAQATPSCPLELPLPTSDRTQHVSYPVHALVDIPMNAPLTRSSRTSSLSSSLSSFRFGGSLSQLWASQMSLTARMPNVKSTGNLNAETATMPSLGNQYFAFGGSLPELSLTSLSRLLPNSGVTTDTSMSSCPGLFTLLHPPLYVYPSQQHLTTPFINANGSITFGSFLSGGSSLCSTQKAPPTSSESREGSSELNNGVLHPSILTASENKVNESGYSKLSDSSTSLSSNTSNVSMFAPIVGPLIRPPPIVTSLPAFHTIADSAAANCVISNSNGVPTPIHSTHISAPNLDTLACVATAPPHHPLTSPVSPHAHPGQHHILHTTTTTTGGAPHSQPHPHIDSKEGILRIPTHFISRPGVIQTANSIPVPSIKLERDARMPSQDTPQPIQIFSNIAHGGLGQSEVHGHPLSEHLPHGNSSVLKRDGREKPYKCDHPGCDRSFSFPAHLRSHVQQFHISYRPCKCDFPSCGKRFYTPQHLNVHKRIHTGERPFVCPYSECNKAFTTAGNLKNHIRTHTGERPYSCKFDGCTKCFAEMSSLKKHELTHTGEKPYKCRVCGKAFSQAGSRNTHERKHARTDEGEGEAKGPRRFRIKRISSPSPSPSDTALIKTEPA